MSRIGRLPVALPAGVEVKVDGNNVVTVKGPKGELQEQISEQKDRAKEIEAFEEYVKTDDYIKEMAEDRLNLVDPNEIVFKPSE